LIVELSQKASAELDSAIGFIRNENPRAAERVAAAIDRGIDSLSTLPGRSRQGRVAGTHELVVRGAPYVVIYSVTDRVFVLSIRHTSRGAIA
jgi:toxin ParE1/3/4